MHPDISRIADRHQQGFDAGLRVPGEWQSLREIDRSLLQDCWNTDTIFQAASASDDLSEMQRLSCCSNQTAAMKFHSVMQRMRLHSIALHFPHHDLTVQYIDLMPRCNLSKSNLPG